MKFLAVLSLVVLGACSSADWGDQYPHCFHQNDEVVKKCYELNEAGSNVNASRVEQMLREGGNP